VLIEPAVEVPKLQWYQFYEYRALGRAMGLGLIGVGSATLFALAKPWAWFNPPRKAKKASKHKSSLVFIPTALSIIALVVGIRLRVRRYFKDPEALREYIQQYHNSAFSIAFRSMGGWDNLSRVATQVMMEAKIERELQGFIPGVQASQLNFDDVWQLYNEVSRHPKLLEEMIQRKIVDVSELRKLAMADLEQSLSHTDQTAGNPSTKPSGPPADETVPFLASKSFKRWPDLPDSGPRHIVYRLLTYGPFLQAYLGISPAVLQAALRSDPDVIDMPFDQLISANVRQLLAGPSPLFDHDIVRYKAQQYLVQRSPTFPLFIASFGKWLFDEHVIPASMLAEQFQRDCIDLLDCVTLLDTWYEWPIQHYGHSLGVTAAQQQLLASLNKQLEVARQAYQSEAERNRKKFKTGVSKAQTERDRRLASRNDSAAASSSSRHSTSHQGTNSTEIPIVHVSSNGTAHVTGNSSDAAFPTPPQTVERINADFDSEEMRLQEELDEQLLQGKKSLDEVLAGINEAWRLCLHPELAKATGSSSSSPVQLNLNFSLLGGLNVTAGQR
jgi:hypothetical protein